MLLVSTGFRPGMLLNILQCLGLPSTSKGCRGQHVSNVKVEKSCHGASTRVILSMGDNQASVTSRSRFGCQLHTEDVPEQHLPSTWGPSGSCSSHDWRSPSPAGSQAWGGPRLLGKDRPWLAACPGNLGCVPRVTSQSCTRKIPEKTYDLALYLF